VTATEPVRRGYDRFARYSVDALLPKLADRQVGFPGVIAGQVPTGSYRMRLIARTQTCACCGLKGQYFWLETCGKYSPHLNLYGVGPAGNELMLTVDHIVPKSQGGGNDDQNLQLLCEKCNAKKGSSRITLPELRARLHMMGGLDGGRTSVKFLWARTDRSPGEFGQIVGCNKTHATVRLWCPCLDPTRTAVRVRKSQLAVLQPAALAALKDMHAGCRVAPQYGSGVAFPHTALAHLFRRDRRGTPLPLAETPRGQENA
jgi:hypothetical protein